VSKIALFAVGAKFDDQISGYSLVEPTVTNTSQDTCGNRGVEDGYLLDRALQDSSNLPYQEMTIWRVGRQCIKRCNSQEYARFIAMPRCVSSLAGSGQYKNLD